MMLVEVIYKPGLISRLFHFIDRCWRSAAAVLLLVCIMLPTATADPPKHAADYCNLLVTYACHAKSLWHDAPEGGYWGDGLDAKNQNGAVRGTCNTMLVYALLVRALDEDWLSLEDVQLLKKAGLDRHKLVDYIQKNASYLAAHHKSSNAEVSPVWGSHWQSSLWMQSLGMATLLSWKDLGNGLKQDLSRVAAAEADWVASRPPRDLVKGNTAAEENAWDTGATAVALAIDPGATSATVWWQTLKSYAVNSYSHPSDSASNANIGEDRVADIVNTANLAADWSLDNHGFFHPDYLQVTGQHLGEAWLILALGDAVHGTDVAKKFEPYSLHNVQPVWERVMRPLLLPTGEFAYPAGNDWTYHCTTNQGYFAFIATALNEYDAATAEARGLEHVKARRRASPPGRLLGDSNLEWWWEPLVCKRMTTALLHHMVRPGVLRQPEADESIDALTTTVLLEDAKIWWHRNPHYFFSVSYGKPQMAYYVPLRADGQSSPYTTLPYKNSLLPGCRWKFKPEAMGENFSETAGTLWRDDETIGAVLCLPRSVAVISRAGFDPMQVENDTLTRPGRTVTNAAGKKLVPMIQKGPSLEFDGSWLNIDDVWGMISRGGFTWDPACNWAQRSVAWDSVKPRAKTGAWQMLSGDSTTTIEVEQRFAVDTSTTGIEIHLQDGRGGRNYRARLTGEGFNYNAQ